MKRTISYDIFIIEDDCMRREKRKMLFTLLFLLLLGLGLGYAALSTNLSIDGSSTMLAGSWDIHFDRIVVSSGSVAIGTEDSAATITSPTTVAYNITLAQPGDFYEFTVDVVNGGTIDAMIEGISSKLNGVEIEELPGSLEYSVTYSNGIGLVPNQLLSAGDTETYKVRVKYKEDLDLEDLVPGGANLSLSFSVTYIQADENAVEPAHPNSFATDDWDTIIASARSESTPYQVGDIKSIELGNGLGSHTLRIANTSTPSDCSTPGFSQTACGFVLEFEDVITTRRMNPELNNNTLGTGNVGGWPASEMRNYLNNTSDTTSIINSLPTVLKNAIIDTTVISGHGSTSGETNFTSTDKLYLLCFSEVYDMDSTYDTVTHTSTRQLDYYSGFDEISAAIKKYNGSNNAWSLRSGCSGNANCFGTITNDGGWYDLNASASGGVSPAFRIG